MKHMTQMFFILFFLLGFSNSKADNLSDSNRLFDFAEQTFPHFFYPSGQETIEVNGYLARYYPGTNNYVGTQGDDVYVYGDVFGGLLKCELRAE